MTEPGVIPDERIPTIPDEPVAPVQPEPQVAAPAAVEPPKHGPFKSEEEKVEYERGVAERVLANLAEKNLLKMPGQDDEPKPDKAPPPDPMKAHLKAFTKELEKVRKVAKSDEEVAAWIYEQSLSVGLGAAEKLIEQKLGEAVSGIRDRIKHDDKEKWFSKHPEFKERRAEVEDLIENYRGDKSPAEILATLAGDINRKASARNAEPEYTETERALLSAQGKGGSFMEGVAPHSGPANGGAQYLQTRAALLDNIAAAAQKGDAKAYNKLINQWAASR